jgi:hypothetical protein
LASEWKPRWRKYRVWFGKTMLQGTQVNFPPPSWLLEADAAAVTVTGGYSRPDIDGVLGRLLLEGLRMRETLADSCVAAAGVGDTREGRGIGE